MKKRSSFAISILIIISLILTACGGNKTATTSSAPNKTEAPAAAGATNDEAFTLKVGAWFLDDLPQSTDFKAASEAKFKEMYPNAKVEWDILVSEKYFEKMKAELASGVGDDVIFNQNIPELAKAGYLADLSDQPWVGTVLDATKPSITFEGKTYGAAQTVATFGMFYNKKIFADLGIAAPKNWTELMDASEKIKTAKIVPMVGGFKDQWTLSYLLSGLAEITAQNPNLEADYYNGKAKINGPELQGAFAKLSEFAQKGYLNKSALSIDWPQTQIEFGSGKAAMLYQGNWLPGVMAQIFKDKGFTPFEVGFFPIADENGKILMGVGPDHSVSVNAKSKHLQAAKDFLALTLSQDVLSVNLKNVGLPGLKGITASYDQPAMKEINDALQNNPTTLHQFIYGSFAKSAADGMVRMGEKIIAGEKAEGDLDEIQKNYDKDKASIILP
ncbi:extracellular solute-binding protein [Paenibacillus psychroresistens]|uniref:Extracellular solute-binding protein n=1 Tax=Paenibacillus psychroresistens TaxID=1778678 RepID=A0A6B8RV52_9BACL|nr:extracellular solute-binding protein [Paenibacillus psychroresistens]QGQ99166.1 extracellular solute-binding protein [Paenibacillus psychroresistens]